MFYMKHFLLNTKLLYCFYVVLPHTCDVALWYTVKSSYLHTAMSEHIIHLYGVFNNTINEIPTRGDNAGCSYNMILKTSIILGVNKFLIGIIYILIFIYEIKN